jgi:hypothetical protein
MTEQSDFLSLISSDAEDFGPGLPAARWRLAEQVSLVHGARREDDCLEFLYQENAPETWGGRLAPSPRQMLYQFVELALEKSNRVMGNPDLALAFARRYGALGICGEHDLSCWHLRPPCPCIFEREGNLMRVRERLGAWFVYSRLARAILNLTAKPHAPERRSDLNRLDGFFGRRVAGPATAVNFWLSVCPIFLKLRGKSQRLEMLPHPAGLAELGIQLALVVAGRRAVALCDGCGKLFQVKRQPRRDRSRYCKDCGLRVAWRDAQRRHRAKPKTVIGEDDKVDRKRKRTTEVRAKKRG